MTFYAQRKSIKNNQTTFNNRTGERDAMLRQYFLYCASAASNEQGNEFDYIDFGTVEQGAIKKEAFTHEVQPEPDPEPEPESEPEGEVEE